MRELYLYVEHHGDELSLGDLEYMQAVWGKWRPVLWAQEGRYGWISMEKIQNMCRRYEDLKRQQKGYAKDKPIKLAFYWDDTTPLDPVTVRFMRETSP